MDPIVRAVGLHKHFGDITAVNGLNLTVEAGEIYGLLGPNGSGKTTLIRLLIGLLKTTAGNVELLGTRIPDKSILDQIGYMTQSHALYDDISVRANVAFFAEMCGISSGQRGRIDAVLELVELSDRANDLVGTLSGGMKQRTSLACALVHQPRLLLLDEPTVGVDPQLRAAFWDHFRQLAGAGVTLIVSSHVMDEAERCDRLGFIRQGKLLAEGTSEDLRRQAGTDNLEQAFLKFAGGDDGDV
jgi:ABC-2 type transport system ATP-binding protein